MKLVLRLRGAYDLPKPEAGEGGPDVDLRGSAVVGLVDEPAPLHLVVLEQSQEVEPEEGSQGRHAHSLLVVAAGRLVVVRHLCSGESAVVVLEELVDETWESKSAVGGCGGWEVGGGREQF